MTTEELEKLLSSQPVSRLHRLAHGRIYRHFRLGKKRLIEALLRASAEDRPGLESDLRILIQEGSHRTPKAKSSSERSKGPWRGQALRKSKTSSVPIGPEPSDPPVSMDTLLKGIGVPEAEPFLPDPWQEEAVAQLRETDVVVSVPTGSGKTYVAVEAAKWAMAHQQTVIYTSPLKALSNTKHTEFSKIFGSDQVGILTGDRRDNPQAPLLIMTTEILRNLLYDAASGEIDVRLDTLGLVILDESQYIADPERGVVWEETLIFCPAQAKLLLLSASIGNPQELADWLTSIRHTTCHLIRHNRRSVPLRAAYLHPNGKINPLFRTANITRGSAGHLHPETKRLFQQFEEETFRHR